MCGRYYIEIDDNELRDICAAVERKQKEEGTQLEIKLSGEIFPADIAPVLTGAGYTAMKWGFSGFDGKLVINARSETALTKPMFRESIELRRCLIPASGYFEWRKEGDRKIKHRVFLQGQPLYMAGCFKQERGAMPGSFVILTRAAAGGLEYIHDRMPVIIRKGSVETWLHEGPDLTRSELFHLDLKVKAEFLIR